MSDVIAPIVADTDELSSGDNNGPNAGPPPEIQNGPVNTISDQNGGTPVRKTRSGASSGSSTKPSLSSRLDNLKISTIRQHYYPEGGWGWVICACAFLINMLTYGLLLSYGIFSREVVKEFGEEYSEQAVWLGSLSVSLGFFLSPLIVAFCRRKSTRLTAVFGGLTAGLGCLFTSFALQMHQVFLSYGFVMSLGLSLARVTSSLMIGQYFKRRREKVEAIVTSGIGCGIVMFSFCFPKIISILGWRLGLHAITGMAVAPFFIGICYRSASLYHPQRRAILHLKNQRKKIKDKSGVSDKPPFFDWTPLRNGCILVSMLSAGLCGVGLYSPFFHLIRIATILQTGHVQRISDNGSGIIGERHKSRPKFITPQVPLVTALGFEEELILQLQLHLGCAFVLGCGLFGMLLVKKNADCIVGRQYLCQAAMVAIGLSFLSINTAQDFNGFVLFIWMYGVPCGGLHYSLKMLVFEKIRAKSFSRAWSYVEWAQSLPMLVGIPATGYINQSQGPRTGFYFCAAFSFAGAAALLLNNVTSRYTLTRRRAHGSCSTCTSQAPSCCCTQDFNLLQSSRRESSAGHPKCQKTISFSDTIDVADEESPKRCPHPDTPQNNHHRPISEPNNLSEDENDDEEEEEGNVDVDNIDANVDIYYENYECRPTNNALVIIENASEEHIKPNRYICGHYDGELDNLPLQLPQLPMRQMTVIEEVTSSV